MSPAAHPHRDHGEDAQEGAVLLHRDVLEGRVVAEVAFTGTGLDLHEGGGEGVATAAHRRLGEMLGVPVVRMGQTHGAEVAVVDRSAPELVPDVDGLVTQERGIALAARGADCGLVLLADVETGVVGAVHSGRRGLVAGAVPAVVERMRRMGSESLHAWIGPHACGGCYEVPEQMRDEVAAVVPEAGAVTSWGTPAVDLAAGIRAQLEAGGVVWQEVGVCTIEDSRVWSHRRDGGSAGRAAAVVWMRP